MHHRPRRRSLPLAFGLALALLGMVAPASAATKPPAVGDYQSAPSIASNQTYSVGLFSVAKYGAERMIVPTTGYGGIYYPDADRCDRLNVPLVAQSIPINGKGRFKHSEKTPVTDGFIKVRWKGRWKKRDVVSGSITITYGGCKSTKKWSGGKVTTQG